MHITAHRRWRLALGLALLASLAALPLRAAAWGAIGHRLVAEVATSQLTPAAAAETRRLLALEPGATLASVASWADQTRDQSTKAWHFVNFTRTADCRYQPARHCAGGNCLVGAIDRQLAVLSSTAPDRERLQALKYVVHFLGDVHQPLHSGFADDGRGHRAQVQAFGKGSNLHVLWDAGLVRNYPGGEPALKAAMLADQASTPPAMRARDWAEESCRIVSEPGFYAINRQVDDAYAQRWDPVVAQRLGDASRRLAAVLNQALVAR